MAFSRNCCGQATPYFGTPRPIGAVACAGSVTIAAIAYAVLYRRFDRVMLQRVGRRRPEERRELRLYGVRETRPGVAAISLFTHATLARSPLHQGVFIAISAVGAGLVLNSLIGVRAIPRLQTYEQALAYAVTWAPFALTFAMTLAVRAALVLPIEPRANWVFRMTDNDSSRVEQINAVVDSMVRLGVVAPLAILLPIEWAIFRWRRVDLHLGRALRRPGTGRARDAGVESDPVHLLVHARQAIRRADDADRLCRVRRSSRRSDQSWST